MSEKTIGLKMCRPDAEDGEVACRIMGILEDIDRGSFPRGVDGEFQEGDPDWFDEDDETHLRALYRRLKAVMDQSPGALTRVIGGMVWCVMYEKNEIIDPDSTSLELHPRLVKALDVAAIVETTQGTCYGSKGGDRFDEDPERVISDFLEYQEDEEEITFPHDLEILEGDSKQYPFSHYAYEMAVIESAQESAYEHVDDVSDGWLDQVTEEQREDLRRRLDAWASQWGMHPKFWEVENTRPVTVTILNEEGDYEFK